MTLKFMPVHPTTKEIVHEIQCLPNKGDFYPSYSSLAPKYTHRLHDVENIFPVIASFCSPNLCSMQSRISNSCSFQVIYFHNALSSC